MSQGICLIVDDEPAIREYLRVALRLRGLQSIEAGTAVEALLIVEKLSGQIDLLITDIQMPGDMDGVDLAYSVKNRFSAIPLILVSGNCNQAPPDFTFVKKPFMTDAILQAIDKVMHQSRVQGAQA